MLSKEITERFSAWLEDAKAEPSLKEPTAMNVATADAGGKPSSRIVLLKGFDARGFVFYSNSQSQKGGELAQNQHVALCFYWMPLSRQVRVEGIVERVTDAEADEYFASRRRESQIGAWASQQSRPLDARATFENSIAEYTKKFEGKPVHRPSHWWGWRVIPSKVEFWQERDFRLHEREVFTREGQEWKKGLLYP